MSLDIYLTAIRPTEVFHANITHNLGRMANAAGFYEHLWHPKEEGITLAQHLIAPLSQGIALMKADPARYKAFDAPNGWGTYDDFVPWLEKLLQACQENPDADISVSI
jgi:hypothetical protein